MAANSILMEQLKQILYLRQSGLSIKAIVRHTGVSRPTVKKYLARVRDAMVGEDDLKNPKVLGEAIFNNDSTDLKGERYRSLLEHFSYAETELNKTGMTRQLLWTEYKTQHRDGYNYSQYCFYFNEFIKKKEVVMHLDHIAGETIMIDFAGKKISYVDPASGELIACQIFVAVLPHSGLIFCFAVHTQNTYDFISCINAMLRYYGGFTLVIICDNLKTSVTRPSRYEPVFTEMCYQLSEHYGTSFSATRPYYYTNGPAGPAIEDSLPLIFVNSCRSNDGRRAVFSPIRLESFNCLDAIDMCRFIYCDSFHTIYPDEKVNGLGRAIKLGTALNCSELFPLFSAPATIDSLGSFVDGGYHENSGLKTTLEVCEIEVIAGARFLQGHECLPHLYCIPEKWQVRKKILSR